MATPIVEAITTDGSGQNKPETNAQAELVAAEDYEQLTGEVSSVSSIDTDPALRAEAKETGQFVKASVPNALTEIGVQPIHTGVEAHRLEEAAGIDTGRVSMPTTNPDFNPLKSGPLGKGDGNVASRITRMRDRLLPKRKQLK